MELLYFQGLLIAFLWGISVTVQKYVLKDIDASTYQVIGSFIYFITTLLFGLYNYDKIKADSENITMKNILCILFVSLFGSFFANLYFNILLKDNSSSIVGALAYTAPLFTLFASYFFLNEDISLMSAIGIIVTICGVIILIVDDNLNS